MPAVTRVGDNNTGHDACPPTALVEGSANVFANGLAVGRVGDSYAPHGCTDHPSHVGTIASGASHCFINGLAAGRVGDAVSCGGSVAAGAPNVDIGNGGGEITANCVKASVTKTLLWEDANETDKTILSLPDIAKNMSSKASTDKDAQGWLYLAQLFERWLANNEGELDTTEPAFIIDYDWLISYEGIRYIHNDLEQSAFNGAAQDYFTSQIIKYFLDKTEFDCRESYESNAPIYCNSRTIKDSVRYNYLTAEGVYVCLAAFMLYALPKGTIQQIGNNKYRITVEEIYLGAFDSFNFEGDQDYLFWSYKDKDFSKISIFDENYRNLKNEHFRTFKKTYNRGKDFYVKTNLHKIVNFSPVTFEIELN